MVITRQLVSSIAHVPEGPLCWNKDGQMIHCFEDMNVSFHSHGGSISATESTYPPASASNRDGKKHRGPSSHPPRVRLEFFPLNELSSSLNSFSITVSSHVADECSNNNEQRRRQATTTRDKRQLTIIHNNTNSTNNDDDDDNDDGTDWNRPRSISLLLPI